MPERIFKYHDTREIIEIAKSLGQALTTGSTTTLRNSSSGFLVETSALSVPDIKARYMDARYEIFLRGRGTTPTAGDGDSYCATLEPTDPRREKIMRLEVDRGGTY